jgi:hypothetical protein
MSGNHFMIIQLKPDCTLPHTSPMWEQYFLENMSKWLEKYIHQMSVFNNLKRSHGDIIVEDYVTRPKIVVDVDPDDSIVHETVDPAED